MFPSSVDIYIFICGRPSKSTLTDHDQFEALLRQALMSRSGPAVPLTDRTLKLVTGRGTTPSVMRSLVFLLALLLNGQRGSPQHATPLFLISRSLLPCDMWDMRTSVLSGSSSHSSVLGIA